MFTSIDGSDKRMQLKKQTKQTVAQVGYIENKTCLAFRKGGVGESMNFGLLVNWPICEFMFRRKRKHSDATVYCVCLQTPSTIIDQTGAKSPDLNEVMWL